MRHILLAGLLVLPGLPAMAQTPGFPGSDDAVTSPACDIINFAFCPQPPRPAPPFPDPEGDAETAARRPSATLLSAEPAPVRAHHRHRKPRRDRS